MSDVARRPGDFQPEHDESRLIEALRIALADPSGDFENGSETEFARTSANAESITAALRICMETSIEMTPELLDELTRDVREALEERAQRTISSQASRTPHPS